MKLTFLCFDEELVVEETLQDLRNILDMGLLIRREDEDIIQVDTGSACPGGALSKT